MKKPILYVIGDSTVSSFNDPYYYPRYGYGTKLECYFKDIEIVNLALSGRSSKSFIEEENYKKLMLNLKPNDFLMIGFGHNDEKSDDPLRFTDASKLLEDKNSFSYFLYKYYIQPALSVKAIPILCTPICRVDLKNDYTKNSGHITSNGDYRKAILNLGKKLNVTVLDLTLATKQQYMKLGYLEAMKYHATIAGKYDKDNHIVPDLATVDTTHLNAYGAKYIAYLVASLIKETNCPLKAYALGHLIEPKETLDLVPNPAYKVRVYETPNLKGYHPKKHFKTLTEGWYGTAFGECGGLPDEEEHGFVAKEISDGTFCVGQGGSAFKGKISFMSDGLAFCFRKMDANINFILSAKAKVLQTAHVKQAGFGLMLRDDCYIHQKANTEIITSNFLAAGLVTTEIAMSPIFYREQAELHKEEPLLDFLYQKDDVVDLKIERVGQSMKMSLDYKGKCYSKIYVDFDLLAIDHSFMYVGMFATRGTVVEFTNVNLVITGLSQGA
ncbi:MAG: GDSL-type esterase/lipase family protein [Roseburia sp.]|nr:GDSL-type esterase/lipase family protein [Anaeroplasma bactoclasticum]MCM1196974.1 GDSL-type esterase/lipase family protein [Roseburia sp.]MCM1556641.1 GDSL-type esterase/lipase family protein [Anaeroplasma bactoclasticum]